jgi:hypothetical protein
MQTHLILPVHWVKNSPLSSTQDYEIELGKVREFPPPKKTNGVKAESFLLTVPVNLNSPFLLNLNLPVHWVKNSPLSSTQDYKIELGKVREFFIPPPKKKT